MLASLTASKLSVLDKGHSGRPCITCETMRKTMLLLRSHCNHGVARAGIQAWVLRALQPSQPCSSWKGVTLCLIDASWRPENLAAAIKSFVTKLSQKSGFKHATMHQAVSDHVRIRPVSSLIQDYLQTLKRRECFLLLRAPRALEAVLLSRRVWAASDLLRTHPQKCPEHVRTDCAFFLRCVGGWNINFFHESFQLMSGKQA